MGTGYTNCCTAVHSPGLAVAAFAGNGPGGHSGRGGTPILAIGGWSDCRSRHAATEDWAAVMVRRTRLTHTVAKAANFHFWCQTKRDKATGPPRCMANVCCGSWPCKNGLVDIGFGSSARM